MDDGRWRLLSWVDYEIHFISARETKGSRYTLSKERASLLELGLLSKRRCRSLNSPGPVPLNYSKRPSDYQGVLWLRNGQDRWVNGKAKVEAEVVSLCISSRAKLRFATLYLETSFSVIQCNYESYGLTS